MGSTTVRLGSGNGVQQKRIEALRPIREDEVTAMVESIFNDCTNLENLRKSVLVKKYLGAVAFNNITRLAFGKSFVNSKGATDEKNKEFKAIVVNGLKLGASLAMAKNIPWLSWMFPLKEEVFAKQEAHRDKLIRAIMEEHTLARKESGGASKRGDRSTLRAVFFLLSGRSTSSSVSARSPLAD